jgi:3-hydroxyisobutyrate dehydrogenase
MSGTSSQHPIIGLVGLGAMGRGVAVNLMRKGYRVIGFDVNPEALAWLKTQGGEPAESLSKGVNAVDVLISFVVNDEQTEAVLFGEGGAVGHLKRGSLVITCSTMPPSYVEDLGRRLELAGLALVDAPVTGGKVGAESGTLTIMVAGDPANVQRASPVLETFGKRVFVLGDKPGMGSQMKVINQLLCGVHLAAAGEALGLAHRSGLPMATTLEILKSGAASSWMLGDRGPRMVSESFEDVTSAVDIFVKDLGLVADAAREAKFPAPIAQAAFLDFLGASARGWGKLDDSAVFKHYTELFK